MNHYVISKFNDNGTPVAEFGYQGVVVERQPGYHNNQYLRSMKIGPDGNLVLMGGSGGFGIWTAVKNPADGSDVKSFGSDGLQYFDPTYGADVPAGLIVTPENQIVIATTTLANRWSVVKCNSYGTIQPDFGVSFYAIQNSGNIATSFIPGFAMFDDGRYVLIGGSKAYGSTHYDLTVYFFKDNPENVSGIFENPALNEGSLMNFPNPFSQLTTISWTQKSDSHVSLVLYDIYGRRIADLVDRQIPAGEHHYILERKLPGQGCLAAGHYFCRLAIQSSGISGKVAVKNLKLSIID
jgi:hypothetical protein